jgi:hypothetical protein
VVNPGDLETRVRLVGYYWRGARQETPAAKIAARRKHILWVIEHHPSSRIAALRQLTIDPVGHPLADREGYEQVAKLWLLQVERHGGDVNVLANAGGFFMLPDKVRAEELFKRAQQVEPRWSRALGHLYAIGILGLEMMNENGLPTSHNPAEAEGAFARHAREELEKSADAEMLGTAGSTLSSYGVMLEAMFRGSVRPFRVDYAPLAEALLTRAQQLDPANPAWPQDLEQFRKWRSEPPGRK